MKSRTISELLTGDYPRPGKIWGESLTTHSFNLLYAPRGTGKTFLVIKLGHSIACALDFLGFDVPEKRSVIVFDGEMPAHRLRERWSETIFTSDVDPDPQKLKFVTFEDCPNEQIYNLADPEAQKAYYELGRKSDVWIIDNLNSCARAMEKYDDEFSQWNRIQDFMIKMRGIGKCIILVHHTNKGGVEQSGGVQKENLADTVIALRTVKFPRDYPGARGLNFKVEFTKQRNVAEHLDPFYANYSDQIWSATSEDEFLANLVLFYDREGYADAWIAKTLHLTALEVKKIKRKFFPEEDPEW